MKTKDKNIIKTIVAIFSKKENLIEVSENGNNILRRKEYSRISVRFDKPEDGKSCYITIEKLKTDRSAYNQLKIIITDDDFDGRDLLLKYWNEKTPLVRRKWEEQRDKSITDCLNSFGE